MCGGKECSTPPLRRHLTIRHSAMKRHRSQCPSPSRFGNQVRTWMRTHSPHQRQSRRSNTPAVYTTKNGNNNTQNLHVHSERSPRHAQFHEQSPDPLSKGAFWQECPVAHLDIHQWILTCLSLRRLAASYTGCKREIVYVPTCRPHRENSLIQGNMALEHSGECLLVVGLRISQKDSSRGVSGSIAARGRPSCHEGQGGEEEEMKRHTGQQTLRTSIVLPSP